MSFTESGSGDFEQNANSDDDSRSTATSSPTAARVLEYIGAQLTQLPDRVEIKQEMEQDHKVRLTLIVDKADMGRVIGRHGKIAGSIRAVVRAAAAKDGLDASVEIQERLN